ncbi:hypothetical protein J3R30DRAFT_3709880 [Lentinula aciculospora]|uniref:HTH CENPB-type domain-containing protein n=1 Tax=Lentinula aciculospora TaxID=153920 RepID=A0A9W9DIV0_9AGAR|nr:hypothetical protein J3R30DRAFT_3709880 [Lentinula aciculospora]
MPTAKERTVRAYAPYRSKPGPKKGSSKKEEPKSSAQPRIQRQNLTLADWFEVFEFIDSHPGTSQDEITQHFRTRYHRPLVFSQATLSRKVAQRKDLEQHANETPMALSSKRPYTVTSPQVEEALVLWQKSMEAKNENITGAMLVVKRAWFEQEFNIPDQQHLRSAGWVQAFLRRCVSWISFLTVSIVSNVLYLILDRIGRVRWPAPHSSPCRLCPMDWILFLVVSLGVQHVEYRS